MFSYFCGPDQSRWVVRDYRTPESALETFLEAVRREHTQTIAEALSEDAKRAYGLTGIFETTLAWERLKTEVPGLHLLGEAAVPPLQPSGDGRWRATLTVAGQVIDLWLVEQPFWDVHFRVEGEAGLEHAGSYVTARSFKEMLLVQSDLDTTIDARVRDPRLPTLEPGQLRELRLGHDWKVDRFEVPPSK